LLAAILVASALTCASAQPAIAAHQPSNSAPPPLSTNVSQSWTNDPAGYIRNHGCFGVDDNANWNGSGTLAPGQTYTFAPSYPTCETSEVPTISMHIDWTGATHLQMQAANPFDYEHWAWSGHLGQTLTAPVVPAANGQQANLCMLDVQTPSSASVSWSITITNSGSQMATVNLSGQETNGWPSFWYTNCIRSDVAGNLWNDAQQVADPYYETYTNSGAGRVDYMFHGPGVESNGTGVASASPADFNGDGVVDQADVSMAQAHLGQGNGYGCNSYDPNWQSDGGQPYPYYDPTTYPWAPYDLDCDGYVTQHDVSEVQALVGKPLPLDKDYLPPWAVITSGATVPAGASSSYLGAFASDSDILTHVDFAVNGKLICTDWDGTPGWMHYYNSNPNTMFGCSWKPPKSAAVASQVTVTAYDAAGMSYSTTQTITTQ
jgi:hypothetical protein